MTLNDLLRYDDIVIQCHNDPDADAIASGWGVLRFLESRGKSARLVYGGPSAIQKANLRLMVSSLDIPVEHVQALSPPPELLILVDCQPGNGNVQTFPAAAKASIDHHKTGPDNFPELPALREIRDNYGACSTIVWDMLVKAGLDVGQDERLSTALYYGLFMDTGRMEELRHPMDKDLRSELEFHCSKNLLFQLQNCNLSHAELHIAGRALSGCRYDVGRKFALAEVETCDPNILGVISDMMMEVETFEVCVAYCLQKGGAKLSVRSCTSLTRANELAAELTDGNGGGHPRKAGGFLARSSFNPAGENPIEDSERAFWFLWKKLEQYFEETDVWYSETDQIPDLTGEPLFQKLRQPLGYIRATDLYPAGTRITVRMLEGEQSYEVTESLYFMIGISGEVYTNDEAYFRSHNDPIDAPYQYPGEYAPRVEEVIPATGTVSFQRERKNLADFTKTCMPRDESFAHARRLTRRTKVITPYGEGYLLGKPGDWLLARAEQPRNIYVVREDIFPRLYRPVSE